MPCLTSVWRGRPTSAMAVARKCSFFSGGGGSANNSSFFQGVLTTVLGMENSRSMAGGKRSFFMMHEELPRRAGRHLPHWLITSLIWLNKRLRPPRNPNPQIEGSGAAGSILKSTPNRRIEPGFILQSTAMAIARTGVYVDDYLEYSSTLAGDLQRILSTMRELDERAHGIMGQTKEQIKYLLGVPSHGFDRSNMDDDESASERMKKDIEASQDNALSLCTEKVLLARQAYDLIESHIKRLDEDLGQFAEDLKQEGKIPPDEPSILPAISAFSRDDKRRPGFSTPQATKKFREREWDRERGMDFDLMPPPGSNKKTTTPMDVDQTIDPNEPTYCICHQISYGDMIACDNDNCEGGEWFHYTCVGLTPETRFKGKWFCPTCRNL